jgi:protein-tyrosine phosphatase
MPSFGIAEAGDEWYRHNICCGRRTTLGVLRWVKHLPDRLLHPLRRGAAATTTKGMGLPRSVLFVCHGNIYRSPYAAYRFQALLPTALVTHLEITSGGFVGPGRPSPDNAVVCASGRGIDLTPHESSLLTLDRVRASALVVVMEAKQKRTILRRFGIPAERVLVLGDLDPNPIETRAIRDPWNQPDEVLASSYERIDRCLEVLVRGLPGARE